MRCPFSNLILHLPHTRRNQADQNCLSVSVLHRRIRQFMTTSRSTGCMHYIYSTQVDNKMKMSQLHLLCDVEKCVNCVHMYLCITLHNVLRSEHTFIESKCSFESAYEHLETNSLIQRFLH